MNIDKYITTKNQDLNVAFTSGIQTNAPVDQIAVEDIEDKVYRSERQVVLQLQYLLMITPLSMCNK